MSVCKVCKAKDDELKHLREQVKDLSGKLVELASRSVPPAYPDVFSNGVKSTWDGSGVGRVGFNEFGEREIEGAV